MTILNRLISRNSLLLILRDLPVFIFTHTLTSRSPVVGSLLVLVSESLLILTMLDPPTVHWIWHQTHVRKFSRLCSQFQPWSQQPRRLFQVDFVVGSFSVWTIPLNSPIGPRTSRGWDLSPLNFYIVGHSLRFWDVKSKSPKSHIDINFNKIEQGILTRM